jgi:hypothetical protein
MSLLALTLTAAIRVELDFGTLLRRLERPPAVTCRITTVGYRVTGASGRRFTYADEVFTIPEEGFVELIADRRHRSIQVDGRTVAADAMSRDAFGFRIVTLPPAP